MKFSCGEDGYMWGRGRGIQCDFKVVFMRSVSRDMESSTAHCDSVFLLQR